MPSEAERKLHELTHLPYRDWCQHCVAGKGKENHHKTLKNKTPSVQLDYSYLKQGPDEKLIKVKPTEVTKEEAETLMAALTAIGTLTGLMLHCPIPKKGAHKYSEQELRKFLMEIGRGTAQLRSDNASTASSYQEHNSKDGNWTELQNLTKLQPTVPRGH